MNSTDVPGNRLRFSTRMRPVTSAAVAAVVAMFLAGGSPAFAVAETPSVDTSDCGDVIQLAAPGTWETNEGADRKTVPGMLAQITGPVEQELSSGASSVVTVPSTSTTTTTTKASPTTSSGSSSTSKPSTPSSTPRAKAREIRVVSEQIPYVAQVGGPVAGVVTGNSVTLKESRAEGLAALELAPDSSPRRAPCRSSSFSDTRKAPSLPATSCPQSETVRALSIRRASWRVSCSPIRRVPPRPLIPKRMRQQRIR